MSPTNETGHVGGTYTAIKGIFTAALIFGVGSEREQFEQELLEQNANFSLPHRTLWATLPSAPTSWLLGVRKTAAEALWGFALEVTHSRALPGHLLLRAERVSPPAFDDAVEPALRMLTEYARSNRRILRISLELLSPDPEGRGRIAQAAANVGFHKHQRPRMYTQTLVVDLRPSEPEIFATFHGTARRHIRAASKRSLSVESIVDPIHAERIVTLSTQTMARTGGDARQPDWANIIAFSGKHPHLSRIAGLFRTDTNGPDSLLAFAWGRHHGDHADYAAAASARPADIRVPLGYAPAWDLMCWAKQNGASWFDFGGVTPGMFGGDDPLGGISDFKRYFAQVPTTVGEEWVFEPHRTRAKLANLISTVAARARSRLRSP